LKGNRFTDGDFLDSHEFVNLKCLNLAVNHLKKIPSVFFKARSLKSIDLSFNAIEEIPEEFGCFLDLFFDKMILII